MGYLNKPISRQVSEAVTLGKQEVGLISSVMGLSFNEELLELVMGCDMMGKCFTRSVVESGWVGVGLYVIGE